MLWDTHLHTRYSGDSTAEPEDMVQAALQQVWMASALPIILITTIQKNRNFFYSIWMLIKKSCLS